MDNDKLNTALYEKLSAEQDNFRDWLLTQPPEEILHHTYEYSVREDIVMAMEELNLDSGRAAALLASPSPLDDIFKEFESLETDYMDTVRDCIENRADNMLKEQQELPVEAGRSQPDKVGIRPSIKEQLAAPSIPGDKPSTEKNHDREVR